MNRKEYGSNWRRKNKERIREYRKQDKLEARQILHRLKINGCAICGYNKCDAVLEFHHVNPKNKLFNIVIKFLANHSNTIIVTELNKCILFCANCHREIHDKGRRH